MDTGSSFRCAGVSQPVRGIGEIVRIGRVHVWAAAATAVLVDERIAGDREHPRAELRTAALERADAAERA